MDWFPAETLDNIIKNRMNNDPAFKKEVDEIYEPFKKLRFEEIKQRICTGLEEEFEEEQKSHNFEKMLNALYRLSNNVQNTPFSDESESSVKFQGIRVKDPQNNVILTTSAQVQESMNRLWDLYKTYCDKVQRLQPEF